MLKQSRRGDSAYPIPAMIDFFMFREATGHHGKGVAQRKVNVEF